MSAAGDTPRATTDRAAIVHFAGRHHLSPARDAAGEPAFSAAPGDGPQRCGWEAFFAALGEGRRGLVLDPAQPAHLAAVPAAQASHLRPGLRGAVAHARRFWSALRGRRLPPA